MGTSTAVQLANAAAGASGLRLLLAEDEPVQRRHFQHMLERQGYSVEAVATGPAALERVLAGEVDILLTDWDMPEMDGAEVCRQIRAAKLSAYVYILMITGHTSEDDMVKAIQAGANDYICKPPSSAALTARLHVACELMAMARRLAAANDENERLARFDLAVGCHNKMYLNERLPAAIAYARRHESTVGVVIVDIDYFKKINDTYGHMVGDEILKGLVERSTENLRSEDWIARFGGEEFLIVLPATDLRQAAIVAEKVRSSCQRKSFDTSAGPISVTISLGVSSYIGPKAQCGMIDSQVDGGADALITRADAALYRSKKEGRNRVTVAE